MVRLEEKEQCSLRHVVRSGDVVQAIIEETKQIGCDLLVIGARPRPNPRSILFGTTTEALIRTAPCPVLVTSATGLSHQHTRAQREQTKVDEELETVGQDQGKESQP